MPRMNILNVVEREAFDSPPVFNSFQRKQYFDLPSTPIRRWPPSPACLAEACKMLIKNCIILELSLAFAEIRRDQGYREPGGVSRRGGHGSAVAWQHLNLLGEYDFSDEKLARQDRNSTPKIGGLNGAPFWGSPKSENPIYQRG